MKRFATFLFLSTLFTGSTYALSSTINLPGGGDVQPTKSVSIPLTNLITGATYKITCTIDARTNDQMVRLSYDCGMPLACEVSTLTINGDNASQAVLKQGGNIVSFTGSFGSPSNSTITLTNLDQQNRFNVNSCSATAVYW